MAISDKLKELQNAGQPQTLDQLFQSSKEGMLLDKVKNAVNALLPAMRENIAKEMQKSLTDEITKQIGAIQVKDGIDGRDGKPGIAINGKDGQSGKDGKTPTTEELTALITPLIPRGKRGGGGSTMRVNDLSSHADGTTKVFTTLNRIGAAHLLHYSSFPSIFIPTTDYVVSGTTITLGAAISAPVAGQSLVIIYESSD